MLKQRLIFGVLGAALAIAVISLTNTFIVGICIAVITLIGLGEFLNVSGLFKKKSPAIIPAFLYSIVISAVAIKKPGSYADLLFLTTLVFVAVMMIIMVVFRKKCSFADCASTFLGTFYISVFFLFITLLRSEYMGKLLVWYIFISAWSTDTFAYIFGKTMGKRKLCPYISPKKTIEGSIGGIVGSTACVIAYTIVISNFNNINYSLINALILGIITSVFSQFGDLAASCIKREHYVKDYGNIMPGHGGILDRFDSVLLISPIVYYIIIYFPVIIK